jgi:2-polyprenyl-6-methoxyphenol hydroxylase-like FAD-dependent oxidoreductase
MSDIQVLIVGAGPTGLVLALFLQRLGVRVRVIDKAAEPGTTSRAIAVQARTLELYRQIGLADAVVARGLEFVAANLWTSGRHVGRAPFGEMGRGLSPFPYMLAFAQDEHERLLIDTLAERGVSVERNLELVSLAPGSDGVRATLKRAGGVEETCDALYVAGCDGAHSQVRRQLGIKFPGGTYEHLFYVADVDASGPALNGELHVILDDADFLAVFPLKGKGRYRLIGIVRDEMAGKQDKLTWNDVSNRVLGRMQIAVNSVNWFSTYHVHHRVAERFRDGRAFLLGDAAHIHSPVGGQGMNTGIGDAVNLAWKLAAVIAGTGDARLLETYHTERTAFAERLVATTDTAFIFVTKSGPIAKRVRLNLVPLVIPPLFHVPSWRRFMFLTVSQTGVHYRRSALSAGSAGSIKGGDRLPWVEPAKGEPAIPDNFAPLTALEWQAHVYGVASQEIQTTCRARGLALHQFAWNTHARKAGLKRDALYLVRPDGYVGLATTSVAEIEPYLRAWMVK